MSGAGRLLALASLLGGAAGIALGLNAGWFGGGGASNGGRDLARGAQIYAEACASCHGASLEGQADWQTPNQNGRLPAPPHDETGHTWHHSDRLLLDIMRRGTASVVGGGYKSDMPGFGDVYTDDELQDVLAWIKTRWPERERTFQAEVTARDPAD
ncbi:c-type cytochrome [Stappia stellulata]|uniref:c-type cytochrome n=1 Tax=Stappia stellulata TaxID=71235 RepID=UPI000564BA1F|nr:cytochrome c [Stappia stellulata]